jgi:hypothetical protein
MKLIKRLKLASLIITTFSFLLINTQYLFAADVTISTSTTTNITDSGGTLKVTSSGSIISPDLNSVSSDNGIGFLTITNEGTISAGQNRSAINTFNEDAIITSPADISSILNLGILEVTGESSKGVIEVGKLTSVLNITNVGTIRGGAFNISNNGIITNINNWQGAGHVSGPLTYRGVLPTNYGILVLNTSIYGKLAVTSGTGSMAFYVDDPSALTANLYTDVLSGVAPVNISNLSGSTVTGTLGLFNWTLQDLDENSTWDLLVALNGPAIADTMNSLTDQSNKLRQVFNNQTNIANNSLNYDCSLFSTNNMCVAVGGRYSKYDFDGQHNTADVLVLGYKVNPNFRVGAHMDQKLNRSNLTGISLDNKTPMFGLMAVYNENPNGLGLQVKVANSYQDQDITATRTVFSTSEAGSGKTNLKTQNYLAELSYNIKTDDNLISSPYVGVRNSKIKQAGYTESTTTAVTDPLTYNALKDESNTLLIGIREKYKVDNNVSVFGSIGVEKDFNHSVDNYSASDVNNSGITAINFNNDIKKTRGTGTVGANYNFTPTSMVSASFNYTQLPYQTTDAKNVYINYSVGF